MSIWEYANPVKFMRTSGAVLPWLVGATAICLPAGLIWGGSVPEDYKQGATVKIMFLHVPSAMMAINIWVMMLVASLIWLIRRHHVSALAARAAAPIGAVMTVVALVTGAVWGQPTWGTWWEWDPRLTSFLILLLFYLGYMALWSAIENPDSAADLTGVMCLVGSVFAFLSRYAAHFWNQGLHQGSTISVAPGDRISSVYSYPLYTCMLGFFLLFVTLLLIRTRTEIRRRRTAALLAREMRA